MTLGSVLHSVAKEIRYPRVIVVERVLLAKNQNIEHLKVVSKILHSCLP